MGGGPLQIVLLLNWLPLRDSNPDMPLQRRLSYR